MAFKCPECGEKLPNRDKLRRCILSHDDEVEEEIEGIEEDVVEEEQEPEEQSESRFYRKKPILVQAYQTNRPLEIETPEGTMKANVGDWIITGVAGEQYPCKPDFFDKTYDPAEAEEEVEIPLRMCPPETKFLSKNYPTEFRVSGILNQRGNFVVKEVNFVR